MPFHSNIPIFGIILCLFPMCLRTFLQSGNQYGHPKCHPTMFRLRFLRSGAVRALAVGSLGVQSCPTLTVGACKEPVSAEPRLKSTLISSFFKAPPRPGRPASSALPLKKRGRPAMQAVPLELGDLPDSSSDVAPSPSPLPPVASVTTPGSAKRQRSRYDRGADYDRLRVAVEDWLGSCGAYLELDEHNQISDFKLKLLCALCAVCADSSRGALLFC